MKQIAISLLTLLFFGGTELRAASIEEINAKVDKIDQLIKEKDKTLPSIETSYDYKDATEGVPPQFSFFFDIRTGKLVACQIHVGHETWSKDFFYYFDENEDILKYLEVVPASNFSSHPASRSAIVYGKDGKVLWKNLETPRQAPEIIKTLYRALSKAADEFSGY